MKDKGRDVVWNVVYQEGRNLTLSERGDLILISYVKGEKGRKKLYIGYDTRNMNMEKY